MGQPIEITRLEHSASDLRFLAAKTGSWRMGAPAFGDYAAAGWSFA